MMKRKKILLIFCFVALCMSSAPTSADMLNLAGIGADGFINGAYFLQIDHSSTGTGVIEPFVWVQSKGIERCYNTGGTPEFESKGGKWTHALQLGDVPIVVLEGIVYREFLLDINQDKNTDPSYLSLDTIEIYLNATTGDNDSYSAGLGTLVYDMELNPVTPGEDNWILMDYALNAGSGAGDIFAYIPESAFAGASPTDFLYLYSEFGGSGNDDYPMAGNVANAGFEEWAVQIPAPAAVLLGVLGLSVVGIKLRKYA